MLQLIESYPLREGDCAELGVMVMTDQTNQKRALKILFDTYWSSKGWKSAGNRGWTPQTPPDDYALATKAGLMFPSREITHDAALDQIGRLRASISPRRVGAAFVESLSSGRIGLRSGLGSYAVALRMPLHRFASSSNDRRCRVCGSYLTDDLDCNILNFERHKWGGVRHTHPSYIAFDLERFMVESVGASPVYDPEVLRRLIAAVESIEVDGKLLELVRAFKSVVPGNDAQRRTVISILGFAGILRIADHPGFFQSFTQLADREETRWYKDDWPYPIRWWKGGRGIDTEALKFWFG
jgi:hypothetical protein